MGFPLPFRRRNCTNQTSDFVSFQLIHATKLLYRSSSERQTSQDFVMFSPSALHRKSHHKASRTPITFKTGPKMPSAYSFSSGVNSNRCISQPGHVASRVDRKRDLLKEPMKHTPKQIPRPNESRNDKPPKKQEQVSLEGTAPRKCSQFAKDILIERDRKSYAEITNG